jgi:hypothetical protein
MMPTLKILELVSYSSKQIDHYLLMNGQKSFHEDGLEPVVVVHT